MPAIVVIKEAEVVVEALTGLRIVTLLLGVGRMAAGEFAAYE